MTHSPCPPRWLGIGPIRLIGSIGLILCFALLVRTPARAASYQQCHPDSTCTVGEFLYDDSYLPLTGASCTLVAKDPDGDTVVSGSNNMMERTADSWYYYDYDTAGAPLGLYTATVCCDAAGEHLCLDKSFELVASASAGTSLTAADVWTYPTRTLSSFGTLANDVWNYSSRSLTSFGTLITDIWTGHSASGTTTNNNTNNYTTNNTTNLNTTSTGVSTDQFDKLQASIRENRLLLERLVNEPVIENFIEDSATDTTLQTKVSTTRDTTSNLYTLTQVTKTRLSLLLTSWDSLTSRYVTDEVKYLATTMGSDSASPAEGSLLAASRWLASSWNNPLTLQANDSAKSAFSKLSTALTGSDTLRASASTKAELSLALNSLTELERLIGKPGDAAAVDSLFGFSRKVSERTAALNAEDQALRALAANPGAASTASFSAVLALEETKVLALNDLPMATTILTPRTKNTPFTLKNKLSSLLAILSFNKALLASSATDGVIRGSWLEEGSVVFRSAVTNPSHLVTQHVSFKYALPKELKAEHLLDRDPLLTVAFDPEKDALVASADFDLKPDESLILFLETEDVWKLTPADLDKFRTEADALLDSLKNTPYYAQAVSLHATMDQSLTPLDAQITGSPAARIKAYREAQLLLNEYESNLVTLKQFVAQNTAATSVRGFVGGSSAIIAWGTIVVMLGGFGGIVLYLRTLRRGRRRPAPSASARPGHLTPLNLPAPSARPAFPFAAVSFILIAALILTLYYFRSSLPLIAPISAPVGTVAPQPTPTPAALSASPTPMPLVHLAVATSSGVKLRTAPTATSAAALTLYLPTDMYLVTTASDSAGKSWSQLSFTIDTPQNYWVRSDLLTPATR